MPIYHGAVWRGKMDYQQRRQEGDAALIVGGSEVSSSPLLAVVRRVQIFRRDLVRARDSLRYSTLF